MRSIGLVLPLLVLDALPWINGRLKQQGMPRSLLLVLLAVNLGIVALYAGRPRIRAKLILSLNVFMICFLAMEGLFTWYSSVIRARSFYVLEQPVNVAYDPVTGYKYGRQPARMACVLSDQIQWSGTLKGNNYGFADPDDFAPRRADGRRRVLVLGDSFSSWPMNEVLWPDYVERLAARAGTPLELLNASAGGYGVANWTAILEGLVLKQAWDVDEVLLAVYEGDDLERTFVFGGQQGDRAFVTHFEGWTIPDPDDHATPPLNLSREKRGLGANVLHLSRDEYDRFLKAGRPERYPPRATRPQLDRLCFFDMGQTLLTGISERLQARLGANPQRPRGRGVHLDLNGPMKPIYDRLRHALDRLGKPVHVIYIPYKPEILADENYAGYQRARDFADFLGARFFDGRDVFRPLSRRDRARCFFPIDAHWTQFGADRFGDYVYRAILHTAGGPSPGSRPASPAGTRK